MMAALIFAVSLATLWMFFVSYCRSLVAASSRHPLSAEVRDVTGINAVASAGDYRRVVQLLQLCPERQEDRTGLHAVSIYHSFLTAARRMSAWVVPSLRSWTEHEQAGCAYFAAVALDRRIAYSREMLAQQDNL
ncbi:MAG TPA: hypothetical protein VFB10_08775 [Candidatus Dormibacteraeota bacterium]|nr:hypothetical protein [Candidatus Dormibacteraeota bacterium]